MPDYRETGSSAFAQGVAAGAATPASTPSPTPIDRETAIVDEEIAGAQQRARQRIAAERAEAARLAAVAAGDASAMTRQEYQRHLDSLDAGITAVDLPPRVELPEGEIDARQLSAAQFSKYMQDRLDGPRPQPAPLVDAMTMDAATWNDFAAEHGLDVRVEPGSPSDRRAAERRQAQAEAARAAREQAMLDELKALNARLDGKKAAQATEEQADYSARAREWAEWRKRMGHVE